MISWYNYSSEFAILFIYDLKEKYDFKVGNYLNEVIKSLRKQEVGRG